MAPLTNQQAETLRRLVRIILGSLIFVTLKTGLVWMVDRVIGLPPWLNYLLVTTAITIFGWMYHSKVSFRMPLTRRSLWRYVQQAIGLKILDYAIYNGLVYGLAVDVRWSVLVTGAVVFVARVAVYMKYVFLSDADRNEPAGSPRVAD